MAVLRRDAMLGADNGRPTGTISCSSGGATRPLGRKPRRRTRAATRRPVREQSKMFWTRNSATDE